MKKKMIYAVSALVVAAAVAFNVKTVLETNHDCDLTMASIDALSENGNGESESTDVKELFKKNHINNAIECTVTETYRCEIGIKVPQWVPYFGGFECTYSYIDSEDYPGKINECKYTGNPDNACDYYRCRKNS